MTYTKTTYLYLELPDPGEFAGDYRPIWEGEVLKGFEVFYLPTEERT